MGWHDEAVLPWVCVAGAQRCFQTFCSVAGSLLRLSDFIQNPFLKVVVEQMDLSQPGFCQ